MEHPWCILYMDPSTAAVMRQVAHVRVAGYFSCRRAGDGRFCDLAEWSLGHEPAAAALGEKRTSSVGRETDGA